MNDLQDLIYDFRAIMTHDVSNRLNNLGVPVLWIIGKSDLMIRVRYQEDYAKRIKDCKVVRIPKASHYPHATYPRRVNKEISDFINSGTYRFSQLVSERVRERFSVGMSLDELSTELDSIKMRFIPKIRGAEVENIRLVDDISGIIRACGLETGVSDDIMIKAVMLAVSQILQKPAHEIPPAKPVTYDDLERLYDYVVQSV